MMRRLAAFLVFCSLLPGLADGRLWAQKSGRPDPATLPRRATPVMPPSVFPPSYGFAGAGSQFFEYMNEFDLQVDQTNRTVTIRINVVVTTGDEQDYGAGEFVNVWIDFDGNGVFDQDEQVMDQLQFAQAVGFRGILTYTQVVAIPDSAVAFTWARACLGYDYDPLATGFWTWGNALTKPVVLGGPFTVVRHTPRNGTKNVDFDRPNIEVRFNKVYDPASVNTNTFVVEYKDAAGGFQSVAGTIVHVSETVARFVPNAALLDGVYYRVTVKGGEGGVRDQGSPAQTMASDFQWRFATMVNLTNKVRVHVFQVARDEKLVPNKKTMVRVYADWSRKDQVHRGWQVTQFRARVRVKDGKGADVAPPRQNVLIKRPDLYTAAEKKNAANSTNFFDWRPTSANGSPLTATIEPDGQPASPPRRFTGTRAVTYWDKSPRLRYDYYFVRVGAWKNGVPRAARNSGILLATKGSVFTGQNFPVRFVLESGRGNFSLTPPDSVVTRTVRGRTRRYYYVRNTFVRVDVYVAGKLYEAAVAARSRANVIVGFIPPNFQLGITGVAVNFGGNKRVVLVVLGSANASTVAHEFAHFYRQPHNSSNDIEGFRLSVGRGWNKSKTEGNQQAAALKSLMTPVIQPVNERFILNSQYANLFNHVGAAPEPLLASLGRAFSTPQKLGTFVSISGSISPGGDAGEFQPMKIVELEPDQVLSVAPGPFTLELRDAFDNLLDAVPFDTVATDPYHGAPSDFGAFSLVVPYQPQLARLVLKNGDVQIAEFIRSSNSPEVRLLQPAPGELWSGERTVTWSASDPDGDPLYYTLLYAPDPGSEAVSLVSDYQDTSYTLNLADLRPGPNPMLTLLATDGLNTARDSVAFSVLTDLAVLALSPAPGDTVGLTEPITVYFDTELAPGAVTPQNFILQEASGDPVNGIVEYDEETRTVSLLPDAPLKPEHTYTVTLRAGVTDVYGYVLASDTTWSFTTEPDTDPPRIERVFPEQGAIRVNPDGWIRIEFSEDLDAASVGPNRVTVTDSVGNAVNGTVEYDAAKRTVVFKPGARLQLNTTYQVTVSAEITDASGNRLEAPFSWTFTTGSSVPSRGQLNFFFKDYGRDADGDGLFDQLIIEVGVTLQEATNVQLVASLRDSTGQVVAESGALTLLEAGDHTVPLVFEAQALSRNGVFGAFTLAPVFLYDAQTDNWVILDYLDVGHETQAYQRDQFRQFDARLLGEYQERTLDFDENGLIDVLEINVPVQVYDPGSYRVRGQLFDSEGFFIQLAEWQEEFFEAGPQSIALQFEGGRIRGHGDASPYTLRYVALFNNANELLDQEDTAYTTARYKAEDFETSAPDLLLFADQTTLIQKNADGSQLAVRSRVFNFGGSPVDTVGLRVLVDGTPLGPDLLLTNLTGTPQEALLPWDIGAFTGQVNVEVLVDPDNLVAELDESNNQVSVVLDLPPDFPSPPTDLSAQVVGTDVVLTWTPPVDGWTGFFVYRLYGSPDTASFSRMNVQPIHDFTFVDTSAQASGSYLYAVRTYVSGQPGFEGLPGDTVQVERVTHVAPGRPEPTIPESFVLRQNYPNPFNPATTIVYGLPERTAVKIEVFNLMGQRVRTLVDRTQPAGYHRVVWDGRLQRGEAAPSGLYLIRLTAGDVRQTVKALLLK